MKEQPERVHQRYEKLVESYCLTSFEQPPLANPLDEMVIGLDYMSDERGYPFCPFGCKVFTDFLVSERAIRNGNFGFRLHCGENVPGEADPALESHMAVTAKVICDILGYIFVVLL